MKNKWTKMLADLLGMKTAPALKDGIVELSQEQQNSLEEQLGAADMASLIAQVTGELSDVAAVATQLAAARENEAAQATQLEALTQRITELTAQNTTLTTQVAALAEQPEDNPSAQPIANAGAGVGSIMRNAVAAAGIVLATTLGTSALWGGEIKAVGNQLMGETGQLWSIDRPWNMRATKGASFVATNFNNDITIERLNGDLEDFIRQNPSKIDNIYMQYYNLPELWKSNTVFGVADRIVTATITVTEVTQPRKDKWLPKGSASIKAEEMRVRPAQIDLQFDYKKMVQIETNWLNQFNREGTQAYKMTFIEYLITQYLMQARSEDANVLVNGVYVETPEGYDTAVSYLLRNDGVRKLLFDARLLNKYRPFENLGTPTEANIVDYIHKMIQALPDDVRTSPLQLDLAPFWIRAYKTRDEQLRGTNNNYDGYPQTPRDYPNIQFVPVVQWEGSDIMVITTPDNIKPLEFKPEEKSMLTIEKDRRTVYVFGDYRLGIGFNHFGLVADKSDPLRFRKQIVWSNNVPLFRADFFVSFYDEGTGIIDVAHNRVQPGAGFTTDIIKINGNVGNILIIKGDITLATAVNVKDNADIDLTADFNLKSGGTLTLVKQANGTYKEVSRTAAPEKVSSVVNFTNTSFDYNAGNEFAYKGLAAVTLAEILNGTEGNTVRIYGQAVNTLTVNTVAGKIKTNSSALLDTEAKFIDLVKVDGLWVEMGRG